MRIERVGFKVSAPSRPGWPVGIWVSAFSQSSLSGAFPRPAYADVVPRFICIGTSLATTFEFFVEVIGINALQGILTGRSNTNPEVNHQLCQPLPVD